MPMSPERWRQIETLCHEALARTGDVGRETRQGSKSGVRARRDESGLDAPAAPAERAAIEQGHAPLDDPRLFELLYAPPTGGVRDAELAGDVGCRLRAVALQLVEDAPVGRVEIHCKKSFIHLTIRK